MKTLRELKQFLKNDILYDRFTLKELNESVSEFLSFKVDFQELEFMGLDYRVGVNLLLDNDKDLYIDVYYLKDNYGDMFITEIGFDSDNVLNVVDYDKKIKKVGY